MLSVGCAGKVDRKRCRREVKWQAEIIDNIHVRSKWAVVNCTGDGAVE